MRIVAEAEEPGARITEVAARNEVYPSLLFNWRRQVREGRLVPDRPPQFVPVRLISTASEKPLTTGTSGRTGQESLVAVSRSACRTAPVLYIKREAQPPLLRPLIAALRG